MRTTITQTPTATCGELVDDGRAYCTAPITATVSWPDLATGNMTIRIRPDGRYEYDVTGRTDVVRKVCGQCADWLMGMGASHLNPTRVDTITNTRINEIVTALNAYDADRANDERADNIWGNLIAYLPEYDTAATDRLDDIHGYDNCWLALSDGTVIFYDGMGLTWQVFEADHEV